MLFRGVLNYCITNLLRSYELSSPNPTPNSQIEVLILSPKSKILTSIIDTFDSLRTSYANCEKNSFHEVHIT